VRVPCLHNPSRQSIEQHLDGKGFVWIDLESPSEADLLKVAEHIKLHPLTLEDARTFEQRPKMEDYDDYMFMVIFGLDPDEAPGDTILREVHIIVSGDAVITIHRRPNEALEDLRRRNHNVPVRSEMFMVYKILDAVTSTFIPVLGRIDDTIDDLEQEIVDNPSEDQLRKLFAVRRDLVAMRRVITPMRDMLQRNADRVNDLPGLESDDRFYFRDLYDGLIRIGEMVDAYRDLLSGATDIYLSTVANRQGEVNRQLTIIATIFLPLTFFTGFFGQNFSLLTNHIINRDWSFWVFGVGLLVFSVVGFRVYFGRKGWVGRNAVTAPVPPPPRRRGSRRGHARALGQPVSEPSPPADGAGPGATPPSAPAPEPPSAAAPQPRAGAPADSADPG
jgi:magnesium transporter